MIHIGIHTDNWRPLSTGFEAACQKIAATGLKHIEFCAIHGQNFIAALGYDPGVSLQSNPRAIRRFLDKLGLKVSQIDGAYPMHNRWGGSRSRLRLGPQAGEAFMGSRTTNSAPAPGWLCTFTEPR